ncbi:hypothetical protein RJ640_005033 [Escallonia rubra]|uniref:Uncharacterized protein n=1 Tax=Escallonia rubra TaxID=112253 RepID=A0AA88U554_9ASTE|nr:hypothetical protein RJ640_005033 [Escallonia rubra]
MSHIQTPEQAKESTRPHEDQGISLFLPKGEGAAVDAFSFHLCFAFLFIGPDSGFELDESDVWSSVGGCVVSPDYRKPVVSSRKKPLAAAKRAEAVVGGTASLLPVNISDWAKILKEDYKDNRRRDSDDDVDGEDLEEGGDRVPPHEFLARQFARTRIASFSVHEGFGRTLKGRDLSRVRNTI